MEQKSIEYLINTLLNWSTADIRTVPGVMHQVCCKTNDTDNNIEYRFHWFIDCNETYVHNHRYTFDTYCLEGEYEERLWEIIDDHSGTSTYQFPRTSGNKFDSVIRVPGVLRNTNSRKHFPGNILHVDTHQFHSIVSNNRSHDHVLTFVARRICLSAAKTTYVLSSSNTIEAPIDEIRPATSEERLNMYHKLQQTFQRILFKREFDYVMTKRFFWKQVYFLYKKNKRRIPLKFSDLTV
jgi:hypothetical protein